MLEHLGEWALAAALSVVRKLGSGPHLLPCPWFANTTQDVSNKQGSVGVGATGRAVPAQGSLLGPASGPSSFLCAAVSAGMAASMHLTPLLVLHCVAGWVQQLCNPVFMLCCCNHCMMLDPERRESPG